MDLHTQITKTTHLLAVASTTPLMDVEILLGHVLSKPKSWLLAHPEYVLSDKEITELKSLANRRKTGEPIAYILAKCEFYGREFVVNNNTLVPRPESETIIDLLLEQCVEMSHTDNASAGQIDRLTIVDAGTGSGALGVTAALEVAKLTTHYSKLKTVLIDIDPNCLKVAEINAANLVVSVDLMHGNLLEPALSSLLTTTNSKLVILANLPYVPDSYEINNSAACEPRLALFGGLDGLDLYRKMFAQLKSFAHHDVVVITESLPFQHTALESIAAENGYQLSKEKDLIQLFTGSLNLVVNRV